MLEQLMSGKIRSLEDESIQEVTES